MVKIYKIIYTGGAVTEIQNRRPGLYNLVDIGINCKRSLITKGFYLLKKSILQTDKIESNYYFIEFGGFVKNSIHSLKDFLKKPYSFIYIQPILLNKKPIEEKKLYECSNAPFAKFPSSNLPITIPFEIRSPSFLNVGDIQIKYYFFDDSGSEIDYLFGKERINYLRNFSEFRNSFGEINTELNLPSLDHICITPGELLEATIISFPFFVCLQSDQINSLREKIRNIKYNLINKFYKQNEEDMVRISKLINLEFKIPTHENFGNLKIYIRFSNPFSIRKIGNIEFKDRSINCEFFLQMLEFNYNFGVYFLLNYLIGHDISLNDIYNLSIEHYNEIIRIINNPNSKLKNIIDFLEGMQINIVNIKPKLVTETIDINTKLQYLDYNDDDDDDDDDNDIYVLFKNKIRTIKKNRFLELQHDKEELFNIRNYTIKINLSTLKFEVIYQLTGSINCIIIVQNDRLIEYYSICYPIKKNNDIHPDKIYNAKYIGSSYDRTLSFLKTDIVNDVIYLMNKLEEKDLDKIKNFCMDSYLSNYYSVKDVDNLYDRLLNKDEDVTLITDYGLKDKHVVLTSENTKNIYNYCNFLILALSLGISHKYFELFKLFTEQNNNQPSFEHQQLFSIQISKNDDICVCIIPTEFYNNKDNISYERIVCWMINKSFREFFSDHTITLNIHGRNIETYLPKVFLNDDRKSVNNNFSINYEILSQMYEKNILFKICFDCLYFTTQQGVSTATPEVENLAFKMTSIKDYNKDTMVITDPKYKLPKYGLPEYLPLKFESVDLTYDLSIAPTILQLKLEFLDFLNIVYDYYKTNFKENYYRITADFHHGLDVNYDIRSLHLNIYMFKKERYQIDVPLYKLSDRFNKRTIYKKLSFDFKDIYFIRKTNLDKTLLNFLKYQSLDKLADQENFLIPFSILI